MKSKKQDGKGQTVLTNHAKIKPETPQEALEKLIRKYITFATKAYEEQAGK